MLSVVEYGTDQVWDKYVKYVRDVAIYTVGIWRRWNYCSGAFLTSSVSCWGAALFWFWPCFVLWLCHRRCIIDNLLWTSTVASFMEALAPVTSCWMYHSSPQNSLIIKIWQYWLPDVQAICCKNDRKPSVKNIKTYTACVLYIESDSRYTEFENKIWWSTSV